MSAYDELRAAAARVSDRGPRETNADTLGADLDELVALVRALNDNAFPCVVCGRTVRVHACDLPETSEVTGGYAHFGCMPDVPESQRP